MSATGEPTVGSTWKKLRRRKVVQWGLGYVAVAWGVVQAVAFAVGTFHWPELLTRVAAIVAVAGLPLTVVLAWFHGDRGQQRVTRGELAALAVIIALGAMAVLREAREANVATASSERPAMGTASARLDRHRIAILPFDNLGSLAANAAFVGGVHDTLITQVAKIPGLSVISRSSVLQFTGKHPTIRDVATALGVGTVLEGSVEREGDRLRIQAQLIDAGTDTHVWAETYDRTSDDLFAVQSEIAEAVAEQLRIHLTGADAKRLTAQLTSNVQAYEHYILGRNYVGRMEDLDRAIQELTTAVTLDPGFAAAHAYLSMAYLWQGYFDPSTKARNLPLARDAAAKALDLDPTLPEAHLAMACYLYRGEPDIDRAASEFERALAGMPSDSVAYSNFGLLRRWQGRWEEARALFARAAELDPEGTAVWRHISALVALGRKDEALKVAASARVAHPDEVSLITMPGDIALNFSCDIVTALRVYKDAAKQFPDSPYLAQGRGLLAFMTGDAAAALRYVERQPSIDAADAGVSFLRALIYRDLGRQKDSDAVLRRYLQTVGTEIQRIGPAAVNSDTLAWIAVHHALLGDRRTAQEAARRAIAALPPSGDAASRTTTLHDVAIALAWAGDPRGAVAQLKSVLDAPGYYKPPAIWCDPYYAPLRNDPGFRQLLAERGADLSIDPHRRETWPKP